MRQQSSVYMEEESLISREPNLPGMKPILQVGQPSLPLLGPYFHGISPPIH